MTTITINKIIGNKIIVNTKPQLTELCFTAEEAGSTVKLTKLEQAPDVNLQTSTDGNSWTPYNVEDVITLANVNDKVYFKAVGSNQSMGFGFSAYNKFIMTGKIAASGNVNSLLEEDEEAARTMSLEGKNFCYFYLFEGCTPLTQAPELPAMTLASNCYSYMFTGCSSLIQAPKLPATTLAQNCYYSMFAGCPSLTQAPELPATTLANFCYSTMFSGCSSLTQAPELPAYILVDSCYAFMFSGCSQLNYISVGFDNWVQYATDEWLPESTGTFVCPQTLIDNTTERTTSTVPSSWTMTVI